MADASTFDLASPGVHYGRCAATGSWVDGQYVWVLGAGREPSEIVSTAYVFADLLVSTVALVDGDDLRLTINGQPVIVVFHVPPLSDPAELIEIAARINEVMVEDYLARKAEKIAAKTPFVEMIKPLCHAIPVGMLVGGVWHYYLYLFATRYGVDASIVVTGGTAKAKIGFTSDPGAVVSGLWGFAPGDYNTVSQSVDLTGENLLRVTMYIDRLDPPPPGMAWAVGIIIDGNVRAYRLITSGTTKDRTIMDMAVNVAGDQGMHVVTLGLQLIEQGT